eukprot:2442646-Pleurochrysis_carterae.AAC.2
MALLACFTQLPCCRCFVNDASAGAVSTAICVLFDVRTNLPVIITKPDPLKRPADDHVPGFWERFRRRFRERRCRMEIVGDWRLVAGTRPWKIPCRATKIVGVWNDGGASPFWPVCPASGEVWFWVGRSVRSGFVLVSTA